MDQISKIEILLEDELRWTRARKVCGILIIDKIEEDNMYLCRT